MEREKDTRRLWRKARVSCKALFHFSKTLQHIDIYGASKHHYTECDALKQYTHTVHKPVSRFVLLRSSWFRRVWSGVMYTSLLWTATVGFYAMSFLGSPDSDWLSLKHFVDVLCVVDILVSLCSAYKDASRQLIADLPSIARHYLATWFLVDLLSNLSSLELFTELSQAKDLYDLTSIMRLLKLFKPEYHLNWIKRLKALVNVATKRIVKLFALHLLMLHLFACLWFLTSRLSKHSIDTWTVRHSLQENSPLENYVISVYYVISTLSTVGAVDITAYSQEERAFTICLMIFGVGFISYTISFASMMISNSETSGIQDRLNSAENLARLIGLPKELTRKVVAHLRHTYLHESRTWHQREWLLRDLPLFLSSELSLFMHYRLVSQVNFFQDKDPEFISEIVPRLKVLFFERAKVVYSENSFPDEMYFLMKGRVNLMKGDVMFLTYVAGSYFGEQDIIFGRLRKFTAQTEQRSEVLVLSKLHFQQMLEKYANVRNEVLEVAYIRENRNEGALKEVLGFEEGRYSSFAAPVKKKSLRVLLQRENNRFKWRRLNTLDQSISMEHKWESALRQNARKVTYMPLVSAEQAFTPLELDARWSFVRRKKKAVLSQVPAFLEDNTPKSMQLKSVLITLKEYEGKVQQGYHRLINRFKRIEATQKVLEKQILQLWEV